MAEAASSAVDNKGKKSPAGRFVLPLALLVAGVGAGFAGAEYWPLSGLSTEKAAKPEVAPLQYVELDNDFTANLKESGRYVQLRIAVSTQGGAPVVEAVNRHKLALISAVLGVIADTPEADLTAAGGRDRLASRMRMSINDVLQRKSGVAGVDDVFLTSFVMQ